LGASLIENHFNNRWTAFETGIGESLDGKARRERESRGRGYIYRKKTKLCDSCFFYILFISYLYYIYIYIGSLISPTREAELIINSLRSNTLSKLTFTDAIRFNALIRDVFPGAQAVPYSHEDLEEAIKKSYEELKLGLVQSQMDKVIQLAQACDQRMGVCVCVWMI
jgi:hypothetical protein